ncbi:hypothetical protein IKF15_02720 [Candidatus Saccharibacteria bacterium]|nr:hypothetical protein [Candidatus Saccharibacteria bacterium]
MDENLEPVDLEALYAKNPYLKRPIQPQSAPPTPSLPTATQSRFTTNAAFNNSSTDQNVGANYTHIKSYHKRQNNPLLFFIVFMIIILPVLQVVIIFSQAILNFHDFSETIISDSRNTSTRQVDVHSWCEIDASLNEENCEKIKELYLNRLTHAFGQDGNFNIYKISRDKDSSVNSSFDFLNDGTAQDADVFEVLDDQLAVLATSSYLEIPFLANPQSFLDGLTSTYSRSLTNSIQHINSNMNVVISMTPDAKTDYGHIPTLSEIPQTDYSININYRSDNATGDTGKTLANILKTDIKAALAVLQSEVPTYRHRPYVVRYRTHDPNHDNLSIDIFIDPSQQSIRVISGGIGLVDKRLTWQAIFDSSSSI